MYIFSAFKILRPPLNAYTHAAAHATPTGAVFFRRSRLFYLLHPTKSTQNPPKNPNKSIPPNPYIYNVYPPPPKKIKKNICPSPKKALTLHSQNRKRRTCSQAKAGQKPSKSQTAKIFSKKALKICTVQIKVVILHHFRLAKKIISRERFF